MKPDSRHAALAVTLSTLALLASAQDKAANITIKVVDKRKFPVVSSLFLNPGRHPLGKTSSTGVHSFEHKCQLGQTFKAEPEDGGVFYNSEDHVCAPVVVLEVFPRPVASFGKDAVELFRLGEWQGLPTQTKVYAGVFGGVTDTVEQLQGGQKGKCRVTLEKQYSIGVYNATTDTWKKLEQVKPVVVNAAEEPVYVFPSSCEEAQPQIFELKMRARSEVKDATKSLSASRDVGSEVQKAMRGVKF